MVDFLSDGVTFRGILAVLSVGADYLAAERPCAHGEALEGACSRAWSAWRRAAVDKQCVDAMRASRRPNRRRVNTGGGFGGTDDGASLGAFHSPLDQVMLRDASQCAAAIGYVSYRHNPRWRSRRSRFSPRLPVGRRGSSTCSRGTPASGWCGAARACWSWRRWHRRRSGTRWSRVRIRRRPTTPSPTSSPAPGPSSSTSSSRTSPRPLHPRRTSCSVSTWTGRWRIACCARSTASLTA